MWVLKMAWRDSRGSRKKLLLFLSSMVLGVAALVAINSFGKNLEDAVDEQSKTLLGADLSIESNQPFVPATEQLFDSLGGLQSRRVSFSSMAYFQKTGDTRLATVRALEGSYPYYGEVVTIPGSASKTYLSGRNALVDRTLFEQFDIEIGDTVQIGVEKYRIVGRLENTPRESSAMSLFSPRIFIPLEYVDRSLLQTGSRAEYEVYFKLPEVTDIEATVEKIKPHLDEYRLGHDTVEEIREDWYEGLTNLYRFLSLVGFMALLLGGLGVASAVHVYIKQRIDSLAILRCVGAKSWATVSIYLVQAVAMGLVGGIAGAAAGITIQGLVPRILSDFLPVDVPFSISWGAVALGMIIGLSVTVLFALLPLLSVRSVSPLRVLRASYEEEDGRGRDPVRWGVYGLIGAGISLVAVVQAPDWVYGLGYVAAIGIVFGLLALVAYLIMHLTKRFFPSSWSYPWRQGLANLYRPHNQTVVLMLALGFGTFLIMTLFLVQRTLLAQINLSAGEGQPNIVLFDIQPDQLEGVEEILSSHEMPVLERVPIVTMRLSSVKGRSVEEIQEDSTVDHSWAFRREYRSSYRDHLTDSETVIEGTFVGTVAENAGAIPVSLEEEIARELGVVTGDTLVFDVQGVLMTTIVSSIREVDWRRLSTNFFVIFPAGSLEKAPQFHVVLSRSENDQTAARLQSEIVRTYPNVSAVDLSLVLDVFNSFFQRISFVIRFMALFSVLTGLIVLAGAVVVSRYQRIEESVLLKTLGASRSIVQRISLIEYLFLGIFATATGLILSVGAGWLLSKFVFRTPFVLETALIIGALIVVSGLTIMIGVLNNRGIYDRPPLEVLRAEV